ncbi:thioredoxin domain-containing protein 5-like, partial [Tropilaelaps mercedesae]
VIIAKVDCKEEPEICTDHEILGYPTLKFFKAGQQKDGEKYRGSRELEALTSWVLEKTGSKKPEKQPVEGLVELTEDNFDAHIANGRHFVKFFAPWCGHCRNLAPTWEKLAEKYADSKDVSVGKVDCTQDVDLCKRFEVRGYPTLLFLQNGGKVVEKYQGSRTLDDLTKFVEKIVKEDPKKPDTTELAPILLTEDNFDAEISTGVTFVKFFAPWCGHCRNLAPVWTDLTRKVDNAKIAKVDCTQHDNLCSNNEVQGYPSLVLFKDGKRIEEYNGSRDIDDLKEFVDRHSKNSNKDEL